MWAPNAARVSVVADFNAGTAAGIRCASSRSALWEIFIPAIEAGSNTSSSSSTAHGEVLLKSDPFGFAFELPPLNASIVVRAATTMARRASGCRRARSPGVMVRQADGGLRGPPRFVGARAGRGEPLPRRTVSSPRG